MSRPRARVFQSAEPGEVRSRTIQFLARDADETARHRIVNGPMN